MPSISTEKVAQIRKQIKTDFPGWKISVRRQHESTVYLTVLEAPYDLLIAGGSSKYMINQNNLTSNFQGQSLIDMQHIKDIVLSERGEGYESDDYGYIPDYYFRLQIGDFDKPFKVNRKPVFNPKPSEYANTAPKGDISIIDYSEKAIVVIGDTTAIKESLSKANGKWNAHLKSPVDGTRLKGWIFLKTKREIVEQIITIYGK